MLIVDGGERIATKFELVINLKSGQTLGITVPESIRKLASEVIEGRRAQ